MASPAMHPKTGEVMIRIVDGTLEEFPSDSRAITFHLRDPFGDSSQRVQRNASSLRFAGVAARSGARADYAVLASASGYQQAGYYPVKVTAERNTIVDLMLLPKRRELNFAASTWRALKRSAPGLAQFFRNSTATASAAEKAYGDLMEERPASLACILNIYEIFHDIRLASGDPRDYLHSAVSLHQKDLCGDRFFAWCSRELIHQVDASVEAGLFTTAPVAGVLHPGATRGYKEVQHGNANLQICFHETTEHPNGRKDLVKAEFDVDYFRDPLAHFILEVFPNSVTGSITDPAHVYCLRWMASRRPGVSAFNPLYRILPAP